MKEWYFYILFFIFAPFVLVYGIYYVSQEYYYRNRPRPVKGKVKRFLRKDSVLDNETREVMSLSEYNYKHQTNFTLDDVYGKGYIASLSEKDKDDISERSNKLGKLTIQDGLIQTDYFHAAEALGNAMVSGDFSAFESLLADDVSVVLYDHKTISGKAEVVEYWKGWRERYSKFASSNKRV